MKTEIGCIVNSKYYHRGTLTPNNNLQANNIYLLNKYYLSINQPVLTVLSVTSNIYEAIIIGCFLHFENYLEARSSKL